MEHFNGPAIDGDVLTRDDEDEEGEQAADEGDLLVYQQFFQLVAEVEENDAHDDLSRDDP